jgi:hypothetical protein
MTVDLMHALYLGVMLVFCREALWFMLLGGMWSTEGTIEERIAVSVVIIKQEIKTWYRRGHEERPEENLTRVRFTRKSIGDKSEKALCLKAAQAWTFLLFLISVLESRHARLGSEGRRLLDAASALEGLVRIFEKAAQHLTRDEAGAAWERWQRHLALTEDLEATHIPKRHVIFHLMEQLEFLGNPRFYNVWYDEAVNKLLKDACREISQATFEHSLLVRMPELLREACRKRKSM